MSTPSGRDFDLGIAGLYAISGGIVRSPTLALGIAKLIVSEIYGEESFAKAEPLSVIDQEDQWCVRSGSNVLGFREIVIKKADSRIVSIDFQSEMLSED